MAGKFLAFERAVLHRPWMFALLLVASALAAVSPAQAVESCARLAPQGELGRAGYLQWANAKVIPGETIHSPADLIAVVRPAVIKDVSLRGADLTGVDLSGLCFDRGDLSGTRWRHADGVATNEVDLSGANMHQAWMRHAFLIDSDLSEVVADDADFDDATIAGGEPAIDLSGASLRGIWLGCGMTVGDYMCSWVSGETDVRGADLTGARIVNFPIYAWQLDGARLSRTTIGLGELSKFVSATATGPVTISSSGYMTDEKVQLSVEEFRVLAAGWSESRQVLKSDVVRLGSGGSGSDSLFLDSDGSSVALRKSYTYRRLLPVIIASAYSTFAIRPEGKHQLAVAGFALGANGHQCSIGDDDRANLIVTLNSLTGWYELPPGQRGDDTDEADGGNGDRRLFRVTGDLLEFANRQYGCAPERVSWSPMRRIPESEATRRAIRSYLGDR